MAIPTLESVRKRCLAKPLIADNVECMILSKFENCCRWSFLCPGDTVGGITVATSACSRYPESLRKRERRIPNSRPCSYIYVPETRSVLVFAYSVM